MGTDPKTLGEMRVGDLCEFIGQNGAVHVVEVARVDTGAGRVTVYYDDGMIGWQTTDTPATRVIELQLATLTEDK